MLCSLFYSGYVRQNLYLLFFVGVFLQHPQIQKKSQYIKYLCCDDVRTLHQWVNGIRIAKVRLNPSICSGLSLTLWKEIVCINLYVLFLCFFTVCVCSMGNSYMWTTRRPWRGQRRRTIGPLSLPPASARAPVLPAYLVSLLSNQAEHQDNVMSVHDHLNIES